MDKRSMYKHVNWLTLITYRNLIFNKQQGIVRHVFGMQRRMWSACLFPEWDKQLFDGLSFFNFILCDPALGGENAFRFPSLPPGRPFRDAFPRTNQGNPGTHAGALITGQKNLPGIVTVSTRRKTNHRRLHLPWWCILLSVMRNSQFF